MARYVLVRGDTLGIRECECEGRSSSTSDGEGGKREVVYGSSRFVASDDGDGDLQ
jgi:hypothetical protein